MFVSSQCHDTGALKRHTTEVLLTALWSRVRAQAIWPEHVVFGGRQPFGMYANDIKADGADSRCDPGSYMKEKKLSF